MKESISFINLEMINIRRQLHSFPELGYKELKTSKFIEDYLVDLGFSVTLGIGKTSVVGVIGSGDTIVLRADIDGIEVAEETNLPYKSQNEGVMHACGHDFHTAILLGVCKYFSQNASKLKGTLKVIFQSAEEGPMPSGGTMIAKSGVLEDAKACFSLHVTPQLPVGTVGVNYKEAMAEPDRFFAKITGKGAHASMPHLGVDPLVTACMLSQAYQNIISREISAFDNAVISVSTISGGVATNVMPNSVSISGTVRTFDSRIRDFIVSRIREINCGIGIATRTIIDMDFLYGVSPVINNKEMIEIVVNAAKKDNVASVEVLKTPSMCGEDFSAYLDIKKGAFFWLGAKQNSDELFLHNSKLELNESCIAVGIQVYINLVESFFVGD